MLGCSRRVFSISPSSMRNPRSLICESKRPNHSISPVDQNRALSPVRYKRAPATELKGSATNFSAVNSGRLRYPRAKPTPPMYSSPASPRGTGCSCLSKICSWILAIALPMVIFLSARGMTCQAVTSMAASVGP